MRRAYIAVGLALLACAGISGSSRTTANADGYCEVQVAQGPTHECRIYYRGSLIGPDRAEQIQRTAHEGGIVVATDGMHVFDTDASLKAFEDRQLEQHGP